jgi:hypothetical protein
LLALVANCRSQRLPAHGAFPLTDTFHKRSADRFENEWRAALYQDQRPDIAGVYIEFDLRDLIEEVYIDPWSGDFFFYAVSSILTKFALEKPLQRSGLLCTPALRKSRLLEARPNR